MFGSPVKLTLAIALVFGLGAGGFLVYLTQPVDRQVRVEEVENIVNDDAINCDVSIRLAHPAKSVRIYRNNQAVELDQYSEREYEAELLASEELTFKLLVTWPPETPETAVLVQVEPDGQAALKKSVWAESELTQEFNFLLEENGN